MSADSHYVQVQNETDYREILAAIDRAIERDSPFANGRDSATTLLVMEGVLKLFAKKLIEQGRDPNVLLEMIRNIVFKTKWRREAL